MNSLSEKIKLENNAANYRLLSRKAVDLLLQLSEVNGVFRVQVPFIGMKTDVIPYNRDERFAGKTKYNFMSMIRYALDSITDISIEPLRKISVCVFISAFFFFVGIIGMCIFQNFWQGIFLIISVLSILFALLFICLTIVAEYIGQIMKEVKHRPSYLIYYYIPCNSNKNKFEQ